MRRTQPFKAVLGIAALVLAVGVAGCNSGNTDTTSELGSVQQTAKEGEQASGATGTSGKAVATVLSEWAIKATPDTATAGEVKFSTKNVGKVLHELVVIKTDKPADQLGSGSEVSEKGAVGEIPDVEAGKSGNVTLKLKAGHYALICNLPDHYKLGMYADLNVN